MERPISRTVAVRIHVSGVCQPDGGFAGAIEVSGAPRFSGVRDGRTMWQSPTPAALRAHTGSIAAAPAVATASTLAAGRQSRRAEPRLRVHAIAARCDGVTSYLLYHYAPASVRFDSVRDLLRYAARVRPRAMRAVLADGTVAKIRSEGYDAASLIFLSSLETKARPPAGRRAKLQIAYRDSRGRHTVRVPVHTASCGQVNGR